jgi:hypothetical protein
VNSEECRVRTSLSLIGFFDKRLKAFTTENTENTEDAEKRAEKKMAA